MKHFWHKIFQHWHNNKLFRAKLAPGFRLIGNTALLPPIHTFIHCSIHLSFIYSTCIYICIYIHASTYPSIQSFLHSYSVIFIHLSFYTYTYTSMFLISPYGAPLAQRASYLALHSSLFVALHSSLFGPVAQLIMIIALTLC